MPVRRGLPISRPANASELERLLTDEFKTPKPEGQPLLIEEPPDPEPVTRLFVVWDEWGAMRQQDRSEIILKAYKQWKGEGAALGISVAMGLTTAEAARMGIPLP